ncbi:hypothetical protein SteCoe_16679 [Stentor coeruleus]|uniref:PA14 domain-containing protein n=1 Tax=Stentor coeruleus TaxID=5963 RepID=A0A1R2C0M8_9CILI|nr:hypothetical protein SteCoe_16679 [Stentor coeruleus]
MTLSFAIYAISLLTFTYGTFLEFYIVSDTTCWIVGPTSTGSNAIINPTISGWNTIISNAEWIWDISGNTASGNGTVTKFFFIAGTPASGTFTIAADDYYTTYLNDKEANCKDTVGGSFVSTTGKSCNVLSYLISGLNKLVVNVQNSSGGAAVKFRLDATSNFS